MEHTATYSPDDNKLRLYPAHRLDADTYARVKGAGFSWAPKQEVFVAGCWTPAREDLLIELCGEIGDEDRTIMDRAEDRAERFDEYSDKRAADADQARKAVHAITSGIPLGQPILVGHHSQRHAERDAERIENGMRRAVKMWETSEYWTRRAAAAIQHARYKERTDVRARRIKTIEAERRKIVRTVEDSAKRLTRWELVDKAEVWKTKQDGTKPTREERALYIAERDSGMVQIRPREGFALGWTAYDLLRERETRPDDMPEVSIDEILQVYRDAHARTVAWAQRWTDHYDRRLSYERAMLAEAGGIKAAQWDLQPGGRVRTGRWGWDVITKVNRRAGEVLSVSTAAHSWTTGLEDIQEYAPPTEEAKAAAEKLAKVPPICNYNRPGMMSMTKDAWQKVHASGRGFQVVKATDTEDVHRIRYVESYVARRLGHQTNDQHGWTRVYLSDQKTKEPPAKGEGKSERAKAAETILSGVEPAHRSHMPRPPKSEEEKEIDAMRERLKGGGVEVVSAPQLFPTPAHIAAKMVDAMRPAIGCRILEPSAGTGNLLRALPGVLPSGVGSSRHTWCEEVVAIEINSSLCETLRATGLPHRVTCADFLSCDPDALAGDYPGREPSPLGLFDGVIMNPPFRNAEDVRHILHALKFLKPGGRLVALCAAGTRQREALAHLGTWEDFPPGSFAAEGTNVNVAMVVIDKR